MTAFSTYFQIQVPIVLAAILGLEQMLLADQEKINISTSIYVRQTELQVDVVGRIAIF